MKRGSLSLLSLILIVAALAPATLNAATYYISNAGDDGNDGLTTGTAWKTIGKVNTIGGDGHTFLFRRGDIFRGEIITIGKNITYGPYGAGERPIIKGSVVVTNWSWDAANNCYVADATNEIRHLFVNGELMTIARYPNTNAADLGWLKTDSGSSKRQFYDADLGAYGKPNGYWNDAMVRIRSYSWLFEMRKVTNSLADGTITLESDLTDTGGPTISPEWGYYLDGKLGELDFENEWYYDSVSNKVYLSPPGGVDPNSLLVEGMCMENGILMDWEKIDMLIEGITFEHQYDAAIKLIYVDGVMIRDCVFRYCEEIGVQLGWATTNVTVECNLFEDMLNYAIEEIPSGPYGSGTTIIQSNVIRRTAMVPGYGRSGSCESSAIRLMGSNLVVRRNIIEDVGHVGIVAYGSSHVVEENIVRRAQLLLDDAGSIDLNGEGHVVRRNLIFDTDGNRDISNGEDDTGYVHGQMGFSIFTQPYADNCIIEQNTLANNVGGLLVDSSDNVVIRSNVVYNTTSTYIPQHLDLMTYAAPSGTGDQVTDNILYSLGAGQKMLGTTSDYDPGLMDRNYYCNPYGGVTFYDADTYVDYTFAEWRTMHPARDANSVTSNVAFPADAVTGVPSEDSRLFVNTNDSPQLFSLDGNTYEDLDGVEVTGSILLDPFMSRILVLKSLAPTDPVHYVSLSGGHVSPYTNWTDAATNIQAAISVAEDGDTVLVTNGTYDVGGVAVHSNMTNRVAITNGTTVRSVNGPENTFIVGQGPIGNGAIRGVYVGPNAGLVGFTVTGGGTRAWDLSGEYRLYGGGAVLCAGGTVSNCVLTGNSAACGAGTYVVNGGIITDSEITNNPVCTMAGGGAFLHSDGTVQNCTVGNNASAYGGGVYCQSGGVVRACDIYANSCTDRGGGATLMVGGLLENCTIRDNTADAFGGGVYLEGSSGVGTVRNCVIYGNRNEGGSGYGGGLAFVDGGIAESCTIVNNHANPDNGGGVYVWNAATLSNCIVQFNTPSDTLESPASCADYFYCNSPGITGPGCVTGDPLFVNTNAADYRLQQGSPCTNAGANAGWMIGNLDLAGNARIMNATVDIGAYEHNRVPLFDPADPPLGALNGLLTFDVSATDPDGRTPSLSAPGWEAMFTDNGNGTGTFAWTPDQPTDVGNSTIWFVATDNDVSSSNDVEIHVSSFAVTNPVNGVGAYLGAGFDIEWAGLWPLDVVDIDLWQDTNLVASLTNNMPAPTSNMTWQASLPEGIEPASDYWVSVTDADYPTDYAMSEDFAVRNPRLLIQGRQRGMYGVWELNEDLSLNRWTRVGGPVPGWLARALDGNRILFQQGFGGAYGIWELNEDLSLNQWTQIGGSVPGWIARALDGNRILFQQGFGGAYGIWELNEDLSLNQWTQIGGSVPGWAARALDGNRILFQQGFGGAYGIWEYTAGWVPQTWTEISGAVPGWIARDLEGDKILFQAGYRGAYGIREHSAGWAPTTWTELRGAAPRGRVVGFDVE